MWHLGNIWLWKIMTSSRFDLHLVGAALGCFGIVPRVFLSLSVNEFQLPHLWVHHALSCSETVQIQELYIISIVNLFLRMSPPKNALWSLTKSVVEEIPVLPFTWLLSFSKKIHLASPVCATKGLLLSPKLYLWQAGECNHFHVKHPKLLKSNSGPIFSRSPKPPHFHLPFLILSHLPSLSLHQALPREAVEVLKAMLDGNLGTLIWWMANPMDWSSVIFKVSSNLSLSMVVWFCAYHHSQGQGQSF